MNSRDGGAGEVSSEAANVRDLRKELNRLNNLIKSVLHKTYREDLEFVWVQNSLLIGLSLAVKSYRYSVLPTHEVVIKTGLEKDFHVVLSYINARVESYTNDLESPVHILEKLVHYIIAPHIPSSLKISMSHVILLCCFHFLLSERHELALKMSTWFSQNSGVMFPEKSLQFSLNSDLEVHPLLFSDVSCWKRTSCDIVCLFKILSSSCFLVQNDYSSVINLHTDDIPNANNELLLIVFYLKAVALFKIGSYDESIELLQKSLALHPRALMLVNAYLLLSLDFSHQGKHHLSIQMLKHCLKTHPSCRVAMLFLSHQYRLLNLQVAEIQSLDLLQEIIGKCQKSKAIPSTLIYNFISHLLLSNIDVTSSEILLHLSLCQLELQKYEMAIDNFEKMITLSSELFSDTIFNTDLKFCSRYVGVIDACRKIILVLLNASKFSDSVEFCEKVTKSMSSKQINGDDGRFSSEICMYKAQGYYGLREYNKALSTISCAVIQLENSCIHGVRSQVGDNEIDIVNQSESTLHLKEKDLCFNLLCEVYGLKSKILAMLEKFQEAVHFSRLAYQISPDDLSKALDLSVALANAGREVESALMWLRFRKFTILAIDELQLKSLIERRIRELEHAQAEAKKFLDRDVESFKILLQQKNAPVSNHFSPK